MRVFGYIRVSSIEQENGFGPEVQEGAIRAYCTSKSLAPVELIHESMSGESVAKRREFLILLANAKALAEAGEAVHVVFYSSDRLARDVMGQESVVAASFANGYRLHSTRSHEQDFFDPAYKKDPMRTAIRQFFGIFNQLDKAIIQQRLDGGLAAKAAKGGSTGGRYPFGYQSQNDEIAPCPEEVQVVRRVFSLYVNHSSLQQIAARVAVEFPELCGHWQRTNVKRVLDRRDLYARGLYRSRLSAEPMLRQDLIVLRPEDLAVVRVKRERA